MPSFLLSYKQKSPAVFLELLRHSAERDISLEKAWKYIDNFGHFGSLTTLRSYAHKLLRQLGPILMFLNRELITISAKYPVPVIMPDETTARTQLAMLFELLDQLSDIMPSRNMTGHILSGEEAAFLNAFLFQKAAIRFLRESG